MKVLLPVDGSGTGLDAVRFAIRLARDGLPLQCVIANVQEPASRSTARSPAAIRRTSSSTWPKSTL